MSEISREIEELEKEAQHAYDEAQAYFKRTDRCPVVDTVMTQFFIAGELAMLRRELIKNRILEVRRA